MKWKNAKLKRQKKWEATGVCGFMHIYIQVEEGMYREQRCCKHKLTDLLREYLHLSNYKT